MGCMQRVTGGHTDSLSPPYTIATSGHTERVGLLSDIRLMKCSSKTLFVPRCFRFINRFIITRFRLSWLTEISTHFLSGYMLKTLGIVMILSNPDSNSYPVQSKNETSRSNPKRRNPKCARTLHLTSCNCGISRTFVHYRTTTTSTTTSHSSRNSKTPTVVTT